MQNKKIMMIALSVAILFVCFILFSIAKNRSAEKIIPDTKTGTQSTQQVDSSDDVPDTKPVSSDTSLGVIEDEIDDTTIMEEDFSDLDL